ncbi:MAG: hypothetical protein M9927_18495 [Anaerolineae bacterium]|nr:hypothetical protein [Anaerolineae bacterium]MCO5245776.1 hypothetical protein [Anaerolineae bacterium]
METYRIFQDYTVYFLTFSIIQWLPVFISEEPCRIVCNSLNFCHREKHLRINAFVIMPTHLHLIVFDAGFGTIRLQHTLTALRKFTGQQLSRYCDQYLPSAFGQTLRSRGRADRERQFWQQSKHPEAIHSQSFWRSKFDYLHDNPRRKGLVTDPTHWRFSSAAYWLIDGSGQSEVTLTAIEW